MKKKYKKLIWIITCLVAVILFVFVIPIFINHLYSRPASIPFFAMSWEAKDVLAFYGSILGAGATILALIATIRFTINSQKEERKLEIKPYVQTKIDFKPSFDSLFEDDLSYFSISRGLIENYLIQFSELYEIKRLLDKSKGNLTASGRAAFAEYQEKYNEYFSKNYVFIYEIVNYGAGNAVNINFSFKNIPIRNGFCVSTTESKRFVIVIKKELAEEEYYITFRIEYSDVCSLARYYQSESFRLFEFDNGEFMAVRCGEDLLTQPRELEKTEEESNGET